VGRILTYIVCVATLALAGHAAAWAYTTPVAAPHLDYRVFTTASNSGYNGGCGNGSACHSLTKDKFLPASIDTGATTDFTNFCLSCHNAAGEAHEKAPGSPSTNAYVNFTGLDKGASYKGDSHSWRGIKGNAATRTPPTLGTAHMPGGNKITCQVCHEGMGKMTGEENIDWASTTDNGDHMGYKVNNGAVPRTTGTRQHLAQYVRVYRTASTKSRDANSRTKKQYLVSPSEYTYDPVTATVTFKVSQTTKKIYVDIPMPYLRMSNQSNRMCLDCHVDRTDTSAVSHEPGSGVKDNHPVMVGYGYNSGLHDTLKASPDSNIFILYTTGGATVLCTSCHSMHSGGSEDGQLLRSKTTEGSDVCTGCHKTNGFDGITSGLLANHNGSKHANGPTVCLDCHTTHGTRNIMLIKNKINGKDINFKNFSGANSMGMDTGSSVCEACHTNTNYHLSSNAVGGQGHNTSNSCIKCHSHATGFSAGGGSCRDCHATTDADVDDYTYGNGTKALINSDEYDNAGHGRSTAYPYTGNTGANLDCTDCHTTTVGHNNAANPFRLINADTVALCNSCHASLGNHDFVHVDQGTWNWTPKCIDCHDPHGDKGGITTTEYNGAMMQGNLAYQGSSAYGVPSATDTVDFPANYARAKAGNFMNWSSFVDNGGSNLGVCRVCHTETTTSYFKRDTYTSHNSGAGACITCHGHSGGFKPNGACDSCHGFAPDPTKAGPTGWADTDGGRHTAHMAYILSKFGLSGNAACGTCHGATIPRGNHNTAKDTAGIDTTQATYWGSGSFDDGGTTGKVNTGDDSCTNVACHSLSGTRYWGGTTRTCGSCHEFPTTANDWAGDNGHTIRADGITNIHLPATGYVTGANTDGVMATNYATATNPATGPCGKCHTGGTHMNATVDINEAGFAACGPDIAFTATVNTAGANVTCSNVSCHGANKTTPNWW